MQADSVVTRDYPGVSESTCSLSNMMQTGQLEVTAPSPSRQVTMTFEPPSVKSHSGEKSCSSRLGSEAAWVKPEVCVPAFAHTTAEEH